ncbi:flagellar basal body P-ring formation chaperone FlgA [Niveispirillum sp. KHB5.9]|uniref:flagellar basal body P-ring formation chaperone FlgA n=1 Tax=Niveispirillum sp. KHB5.9 TaxID=3400269 RepID=UPI003A8775B6
MMRKLLSPLALATGLALAFSPPVAAQADAAEALLRTAIQERMGPALGEGELQVRIATPVTGTVSQVEALNVDRSGRRFAAILVGPEKRQRVEGELWTEIQIPVPTRRVSPGEVIAEGDLTLARLRSDQIGQRTITAKTELVGREARRVLSPGRPVPDNSVIVQAAVARNKPVTLEYRQGPLLITARGRALANGSVGEMVRVQNLDSNRTLTAMVTGPGTVSAAE